ncbi:hypothetical protein MMC20_001363 [Loxospora ochrophaea]|nr:hypothetical protein [Loxospora ochrophaea]
MAATTSHRIWEGGAPNANVTPRLQAQLPSITTLTSSIPEGALAQQSPTNASSSIRDRDSGAWSSQPQSTRSSAYSSGTNGFHMSSNFTSSHTSPHRMSNSSQLGATSHPVDYSNPPSSAGAQLSPGFAPQPNLGLPAINQYHDPSRQSQEYPTQESRRSSLGSQMNQGLNGLHINGNNSPYAGSTNQSQASLSLSLHRERNINPGLRNSRSSANLPTSPLSPRPGEHRPFSSRKAPPISNNPKSNIYNADQPVPGQAYGFPDPENAQRMDHSIDEHPPMRRADSGRTSIGSSVITDDSRLPPGQRRLDEAPDLGTHHHSLQHRQVSSIAGDSEPSNEGGSPYSRTPALRVSHKMAERKRRSEMKDLFENLRSQIPSNQGSKSSKWEILTKSCDYIKTLEGAVQSNEKTTTQFRHEMDEMRRAMERLHMENARLAEELRMQQASQTPHQQTPAMYQSQPPPPPPPPSSYSNPPPPPPSSQYNNPPPPPPSHYGNHPSHYSNPPSSAGNDLSRSLPPLTNGMAASSSSMPGPSMQGSSMQGVQYSNERR